MQTRGTPCALSEKTRRNEFFLFLYGLLQDSECSSLCYTVKKIPWRRKWQPTPVLLPGKSHGQRSLVGYSPWVLY